MTKWEGVITEKSGKPWNKIKLFSFKIEGEDRWFRTGRQEIAPDIGCRISFEERNQHVIMTSLTSVVLPLRPLSTSDTPADQDVRPIITEVQSDSQASAASVGDRIRWQAARRDACNVIVAALHCDALPWNINVAKGKKLDLLVGYIHELTSQFVKGENT